MSSTLPLHTNTVWLKLVNHVLSNGGRQSPRGKDTVEVLGHQTIIDMQYPLLSIRDRALGYKFLCAEAHWILSGDNKVETISPYAKAISFFSDDGVTFFGAYGPSIMEQIAYCREALLQDRHTRQAVMTLWHKNPKMSKDIPCTISTQFIIRSNYLHIVQTMRSSDVWLGWPYDVFNFSMLAACMLIDLREANYSAFKDLTLGNLILTAGSQHIYDINRQDAYNCWYNKRAFAYQKFNPSEFPNTNAFVEHLGLLKDKQRVKYKAFKELLEL